MAEVFARYRMFFVLVVAAHVLFARPVYAYLDPGTGSYVFQMVIAVVLSAGFTIKYYWRSLKGLFRRRPSREGDDESPAS